jgi:hypothetical protein
MVHWLRRQEALDSFTAYLEWVIPEYEAQDLEVEEDEEDEEDEESNKVVPEPISGVQEDAEDRIPEDATQWGGLTIHKLAKHIPLPATPVPTLQEKYGTVDFVPCLQVDERELPQCEITPSDVDLVDVFKHVKLSYKTLQGFGDPHELDTIRATPLVPPLREGRPTTPAYFDTALVDMQGDAGPFGMEGIENFSLSRHMLILLRFKGITVVQIRVIFKLPREFGPYPHPLAYVEYFTGSRVLAASVRMYQVRRSINAGCHKAGIIRLDSIRSACHLYPKFGLNRNTSWTAENVLEKCPKFFVSPYLSHYFFQALSVPLLPSVNDIESETESSVDSSSE